MDEIESSEQFEPLEKSTPVPQHNSFLARIVRNAPEVGRSVTFEQLGHPPLIMRQ